MPNKVLLIGHCGPDGSYLRLTVRGAYPDAEVTSLNNDENLDRTLHGMDLVLVNRVLDGLFAETNGIELIRRLKKDHVKTRFILISNYADAQAAAREAGASPGFGKRDIGSATAMKMIKKALE